MKKSFRSSLLVGALLVLAGYGFGFLSRHFRLPPYSALEAVGRWCDAHPAVCSLGLAGEGDKTDRPEEGKWFRARNESALSPETIDRLSSLGYLGGYEPPPGFNGVLEHEPELAYTGLNLYNSGHGPEAFLIDMQGKLLHRWRYDFFDAFPEYTEREIEESCQWWRRVHLYPDGGLLAIFEGLGLIRVDRDSNLLWALPDAYHHDIHVAGDGTIFVLMRETSVVERINPEHVLLEDFIVALDPEGRTLRKISLLEAFERSDYRPLLHHMQDRGDIFHANSLELTDGSVGDPAIFGDGFALISLRNVHAIATVDLERERVVWARTGLWGFQHDPTLLADGNLLLFDNAGLGEVSRVIEMDPLGNEISWIYGGAEEDGFFSATLGSAQRLPNGNTLITESEAGRAFEVTSEGKIVWEFFNPARGGEEQEFIATLFELVRLPAELDISWAATPE